MVAYLIEYLLSKGLNVATLSRGYGRKTKGFRICDENDNAATVGDEPYAYYLRYKTDVVVTVGEDRMLAVPFILAENPTLDVILLDDAFQHRRVKPLFQVLLTTGSKPFWKDFLLPAGRLREARVGYKRADVLIVTKTSSKIEDPFLENLEIPYFQTKVKYSGPILFFGKDLNRRVVAVAGLADNQPFLDYLNKTYVVEHEFKFKDHHAYTEADIDKISDVLSADVTLLTTEKDAVKLMEFDRLKSFSCAYLPISAQFLSGEEDFLRMIDQCISRER